MKKKNLEKAVILGLILSTGVYGTAWAEDYNADKTYDQGITVAEGATVEHTVTGDVVFELGEKAWLTNNGGTVTVDGSATNGSLTVTTSGDKIISAGEESTTIGGTNTITMNGNLDLSSVSNTSEFVYGIYNAYGTTELNSKNGNITINVSNNNENNAAKAYGIYNTNTYLSPIANIKMDNSVKIIAENGGVDIITSSNSGSAINSFLFSNSQDENNTVSTFIKGQHVNITAKGNDAEAVIIDSQVTNDKDIKNIVTIQGIGNDEDNQIKSDYMAVSVNGPGSVFELTSGKGNKISAECNGLLVDSGKVVLNAETYNDISLGDRSSKVDGGGIFNRNGYVELNATSNIIKTAKVAAIISMNANSMAYQTQDRYENLVKLSAEGGNNEVISEECTALALSSDNVGTKYTKVVLEAQKGNNILKGYSTNNFDNSNWQAIEIEDGILTVTATANNTDEATGINEIWAGKVTTVNNLKTGNYDALKISGSENNDAVSNATFTADNANKFYGSIYAQNKSVVDIAAKNNAISSRKSNYAELSYGYAVVADGNNLTDDERTQINITANGGANTIFSTTGIIKDERTVFATEGGVVNIKGTSIITADGWLKANESGYQANSTSQALIAGTHDWGNTTPNFDVADEERSEINLIYGNGSAITGDIAAGYAGAINIIDQSSGSGAVGISTMAEGQDTSAAGNSLTIMGNALAANGGKINLELGKGSVWQGRADDYQDAADENWAQAHLGEFNAVFSNDVQAEGAVNVALNDGATWDVMGQSWLTKLGGNDGVIDMRNTEGDDSRTSHAVHIGDLEGNHTFVMDLDTEHSVSDMLFIKGQASGEQKLWINSINGLENLDDGDSLRFATVNSAGLTFSGDYNFGSYENAKNGIMLADNGVKDNAFIIKKENYDLNDNKNADYNGGSGFDKVKPGDEYVDGNYANGINWYLEREKAEDKTSDAGKTIINMSKVNYNNAIYMDRLNKRLGEARYISPEDEQGMWVRIRHDRIGKDDAFRSQNTMYEMGYDVKQDCDNGERRVGMAIDYMDGKAEYTGIAGDGDVKRYGLWLYDTWLGDKGHYTDYVLKWGHLENDFDIMARTTGEKITGDYSNNVFSASAEYGKKNDMGNGWYFEPQAQLQFARVTGADYVTSQDTKVSLDGINSLIGRAGFRLGRDLNENSTVYFKADLLHEFLGDQDITATDITGTLREEYENEGTWYDIGFGFATALGNNSYAFMDFEKSFGNDNDETYQINAGVRWTF